MYSQDQVEQFRETPQKIGFRSIVFEAILTNQGKASGGAGVLLRI